MTDNEPTLFEASVAGRPGYQPPACDVPLSKLPHQLLRKDNGMPELSELQVARHYEKLAQRNFGVESGFYPLGSCTMKYNPKVCERVAKLQNLTQTHPLQPATTVQGNLKLMHELQQWLAEIGGFDCVSLQPSAGAHGEFTALLMIRQFFKDQNQLQRDQVLIPDSAHGTNPASATMAGFTAVELPSDSRGNIDLNALRAMCNDQTAALMLTNPNTLGLFDEQVIELIQIVHECGALVYGDGANMNALTGVLKPADTGIDLMHYNLHKTFATPHGGGGPGAGPLAANSALAPYLPGPIVACVEDDQKQHYELHMPERSIGAVSANHGNFGMLVRAYTYLLLNGASGLRDNAEHAVLNANYLRVKISQQLNVPFDRLCMHEFVCEGLVVDSPVRALDICKRLIDFNIHPPTNYFPLIVDEALMIEPTETEDLQTLDLFVKAMATIVQESRDNPAVVQQAPHNTIVGRLDEVYAARHLRLADNRESNERQRADSANDRVKD